MENGNGFDVLEEKVKRASELVKKLRKENEKLHAEVADLRPKLEKAEKHLGEVEKRSKSAGEDAKRVEELTAELAAVRKDREEIRKRVSRLVELLESIEG
jgi:predicted RNase H-like nuclease (RuvC/YqgF family)